MRRLPSLVLCLASTWTTAAGAGDQLIDLDQLVQQRLATEAAPSPAVYSHSLQNLRHAMHVMQDTWYAVWAGNWPTGIDWTRAVLDTHLTATAGTLGKAIDQSRSSRRHCKELENEVNKYFNQNIAYYFGEDAFAIRYQAYDDMLWVVLGWLESIRFINSRSSKFVNACDPRDDIESSTPWHGAQFVDSFARRAQEFWNLTTKGWDTHFCGGGMTWSPWLAPYKNAITNQLFISASVDMHLYFPSDYRAPYSGLDSSAATGHDTKYLIAAIDGYDWLKNSRMTNRKGLYTDGFHVSNWNKGGTKCDLRNDMVYTYNQGVILSGLRGLWESTGNRTYLEDGHELVLNAIRATGWAFEGEEPPNPDEWAGLGRGGILEDRCDAQGRCNQDGQTFKGIFMHHLARLCEPLPSAPAIPGKTFAADGDLAFLHRQSCKQYAPWVAHNAEAALQSRDSDGKFGVWWGATRKADTPPLPAGAIDYRNNASELLRELWTLHAMDGDDAVRHGREEDGRVTMEFARTSDRESFETMEAGVHPTRDLNDRGRGRTVETQSGGVAVLRALWELSTL